jgi:hypothetical protein
MGVLAILIPQFWHPTQEPIWPLRGNHPNSNGFNMEKLSENSHFITLQIDGQSPNLFSSNYITEAKKGHSSTSPKQIMIQTHHQ